MKAACIALCASFLSMSHAHAACPDLASTIIIPLTGTVGYPVCDQDGNALPGPYAVYNGVNVAGTLLSSSTKPAVTTVAGVPTFSANGAPTGTGGNLFICYSPASKCTTITYAVGAPVTGISIGTNTP